MKPLLVAGFVLAVIMAGTVGLVGFSQGASTQSRQAEQRQDAVVFMTGAAATSDTIGATMIARQRADDATLSATIGAEATRSTATLTAYRANLDATVTAGQTRAQATNTALAHR